MEKLKPLIEKYGKWKGLKIYLDKIEYFLDADFGAAVGCAKSLIECICKTILDEQNHVYEKDSNVNQLVKKTCIALKIENDLVCQFANAMVTASQKLGEIRNAIDTSSHGHSLSSEKSKKLEGITVYFLINSVETIACFLLEFYEIEHPLRNQPEDKSYDSFQDFNDYLDNLYGDINVVGVSYPPSELLYLIDQIAYQNKYQEYLGSI
ncbi:abortive infection family protein [Microcoleus sp. herbarium8]|uniref:abortive infection family protein n=1 Tax=Microcoleus sp. herbarium8 TaxID=3055436 RepID=UPI002FD64B9A